MKFFLYISQGYRFKKKILNQTQEKFSKTFIKHSFFVISLFVPNHIEKQKIKQFVQCVPRKGFRSAGCVQRDR